VARPHPKFTDPAAGKAPGGTAATPSKDTQAADGGKEAGS
jgi:hypothetical protein